MGDNAKSLKNQNKNPEMFRISQWLALCIQNKMEKTYSWVLEK
jgi:hypothetical protein